MAQAKGITCDECEKFTIFKGKDMTAQPPGWFRLLMPQVEDVATNAPEYKDLCSGKCVAKFGKARAAIETPPRAVSQPRHGGGLSPTMDPGLRQHLADNGFAGQAVGNVMGTHKRFHGDGPHDGCLVCEYNAKQTQTVSAA